MYRELLNKIKMFSTEEFKKATEETRDYIDRMADEDFKSVVREIGTIPENIEHDSTEEKLYSKASDIVLARCFRMLGLAARALDKRADSADILAESISGYRYSLVADAKCFRLSRAARNQKDLMVHRGQTEIAYWNKCIEEIRKFTREQAIEELIKAKKLQEKINAIEAYIGKLNR